MSSSMRAQIKSGEFFDKLAYGIEGHTQLEDTHTRGMGIKPDAPLARVAVESNLATDRDARGMGVLARRAEKAEASGTRLGRLKAKIYRGASRAGDMLDFTTSPENPLAAGAHTLQDKPGPMSADALERARKTQYLTRRHLAQAALLPTDGPLGKFQQGVSATVGAAGVGRLGHQFQDFGGTMHGAQLGVPGVAPHAKAVPELYQEALKKAPKRSLLATILDPFSSKAEKGVELSRHTPAFLRPQVASGLGHALGGTTPGGSLLPDAVIEAASKINPVERAYAAQHGMDLRSAVVKDIMSAGGHSEQEAQRLLSNVLAHKPSDLQQIVGKGKLLLHEGGQNLTSLLRRLRK